MTTKNSLKEEYKLITVRPNSLRSEHAAPLSIMSQKILFYSIFKIQTDKNSVSFTRQELNSLFSADIGSFRDVQKYLISLRTFGMDIVDEKTQRIKFINAFSSLEYDKGLFTFEFNKSYLPTIENQKERFLRFGFKSIEQFKSKYTIYLYDYLKDAMWGSISIKENIPIDSFRAIFKLDKNKYKDNKNSFKKRVWGPAMEDINEFTAYNINIAVKGHGQNTLFTIFRLQDENFKEMAKQQRQFKCHMGLVMITEACQHCNKINICSNPVDTLPLDAKYSVYHHDRGFIDYIREVLYANRQYDVRERVLNGVAAPIETAFYNWWLEKKKKLHEDLKVIDGYEDILPITEEEIFRSFREDAYEDIHQFRDTTIDNEDGEFVLNL